jgi:hypothetical protein
MPLLAKGKDNVVVSICAYRLATDKQWQTKSAIGIGFEYCPARKSFTEMWSFYVLPPYSSITFLKKVYTSENIKRSVRWPILG